jgi:hypothetical protein
VEIPVLIERVASNGFRVSGTSPFPFTVEGTTREEALGKVRELVEKRAAEGAEVTTVQLTRPRAPWAEFAGTLRGDPMLGAWKAAMEAHRQKVEEETDLP